MVVCQRRAWDVLIQGFSGKRGEGGAEVESWMLEKVLWHLPPGPVWVGMLLYMEGELGV